MCTFNGLSTAQPCITLSLLFNQQGCLVVLFSYDILKLFQLFQVKLKHVQIL
jgi:hypothetical protein